MTTNNKQPHHHFQQQCHHPNSHDTAPTSRGDHPPITSPTPWDVLSRRGPGFQRHPGNVKYRKLVLINKTLYAKAVANDKIKISKGIVAAVRKLRGRFLEMDERARTYVDIGEKKAIEKTSQALREGQVKLRQKMYKDGTMPTQEDQREISAEEYFGYSLRVLQSLWSEGGRGEVNNDAIFKLDPASSVPGRIAQDPARSSDLVAIRIPAGFGSASGAKDAALAEAMDQFPSPEQARAEVDPAACADAAALTMVMDQFPGAEQPDSRRPDPRECPATGSVLPRSPNSSIGRSSRDACVQPNLGRFTSLSLGSIRTVNSVSQLVESFRASEVDRDNMRGSIVDTKTSDLADLAHTSEPQQLQFSETATEDMMACEDKKVVLFDAIETGQDRVSELRFTDLCGDEVGRASRNPATRSTESTDITRYSKISLMDASLMTFGFEDMSIHEDRLENPGDEFRTSL